MTDHARLAENILVLLQMDSDVRDQGECRKCGAYTVPSEDQRSCVEPTCPIHHRFLRSGECQECGDYQRVTEDGRRCEYFACPARSQLIDFQGRCTSVDASCGPKLEQMSNLLAAEKAKVQ